MFNWEKYVRPKRKNKIRSKSLRCPFIAVSRRGGMQFNKEATDIFKLKKYRYANLYFDTTSRVVGIERLKSKAQYVSKLIANKKFHNTYITCKSFVANHIKMGDDIVLKRYELKLDEATGYLYFDLKRCLSSKHARVSDQKPNADKTEIIAQELDLLGKLIKKHGVNIASSIFGTRMNRSRRTVRRRIEQLKELGLVARKK